MARVRPDQKAGFFHAREGRINGLDPVLSKQVSAVSCTNGPPRNKRTRLRAIGAGLDQLSDNGS